LLEGTKWIGALELELAAVLFWEKLLLNKQAIDEISHREKSGH